MPSLARALNKADLFPKYGTDHTKFTHTQNNWQEDVSALTPALVWSQQNECRRQTKTGAVFELHVICNIQQQMYLKLCATLEMYNDVYLNVQFN